MTISANQIEEFLRNEDLVFYRSDKGDSWMVPFQAFYVNIHQKNDGDDVVFHGSPVADLNNLTVEEQNAALRHYMRLNDRIRLGRFCGETIVNFEVAVPIEDSEFTATQLQRCFEVTVSMTRGEKYNPQSTPGADTEAPEFECEPFGSDDEDDEPSASESCEDKSSDGE